MLIKFLKTPIMKIYGLLASIIVVIVVLLLSIPLLKPKYSGSMAIFITEVGSVEFEVEVADTSAKRTLGLMNRTNMPDNKGMVFVFDVEQIPSFWMKNTLIPLDMIFISADEKIVYIQRNAQPCRTLECDHYKPDKLVKYVVEINGGLADKLGIREGQRVRI